MNAEERKKKIQETGLKPNDIRILKELHNNPEQCIRYVFFDDSFQWADNSLTHLTKVGVKRLYEMGYIKLECMSNLFYYSTKGKNPKKFPLSLEGAAGGHNRGRMAFISSRRSFVFLFRTCDTHRFRRWLFPKS